MAHSDGRDALTPEPWNDDDARDLQGFVLQVRELLQAVVDDKRHIPQHLRDDVEAAWVDARADLNRLHETLQPAAIANQPEHQQQLRLHGLTGASLRMKLRAWRDRVFRFGHRMDRPWLRSVLRWADTILESLGDALPGGGAAKEFKESVENFLDDAEADDGARHGKESRK